MPLPVIAALAGRAAAGRAAAGGAARASGSRAAAGRTPPRSAGSSAGERRSTPMSRRASSWIRNRQSSRQNAARQDAPSRSSEDTPKPRISLLLGFIMATVAFLFDGLQGFFTLLNFIIPGAALLASAVSFLAFMLFLVWFWYLKVSYLGRNSAVKLFVVIGSMLAELMPIINAMPAITLGVVGLVFVSRYEDGKSKLFVKAKRRYMRMSRKEQIQHELQAKVRLNQDDRSAAGKEVSKRGGEKAIFWDDFGSSEEALKKKRTARQKELDPNYEAPLYDPEEEAMMKEEEARNARKNKWVQPKK